LSQMAFHELEKPLSTISSEKFLIYPIVANLTKQEMTITIDNHISNLQNKLLEINEWYEKKQGKVTNIEKSSFKFMRETVQNQIDWHRSFLDNLDETISAVSEITNVIKAVDFSSSDDCSIFHTNEE